MNLIDNLKWRYATKRMNGESVSQNKIDTILEAIRLSPTSMGMQAFKVFVVKDQKLKEQIYAESCQQNQVKTCSHLLIFAAYKEITQDIVESQVELMASERNIPANSLTPFKEKMSWITDKPQNNQEEWASRQTYIALGLAMAAAAEEKVDSTPIEGFVPAAVDQILNLDEQNLASVTMLTLGYRAEDDSYAQLKKVRKDFNKIFVEI